MAWGALAQFFPGGFDCGCDCVASRKEVIQASATVVGPSAAAHIERRPIPEPKWSASFSELSQADSQHSSVLTVSGYTPEFSSAALGFDRPMPNDHRGQPSSYDRFPYDPLRMLYDPTIDYRSYPLPSKGSSSSPSPGSSSSGSATGEDSRDLPRDLFKSLGTSVSRDGAVQMRKPCGDAHGWENSLRRSTLSSLSSRFLQACIEDRWEDARLIWTVLHDCDKQDFLLV